jgi:formate hydrogenlyase subunit 6/NADH:ubiquinone oxidoreductase subunit I
MVPSWPTFFRCVHRTQPEHKPYERSSFASAAALSACAVCAAIASDPLRCAVLLPQSEFVVETEDRRRGKRYKQVFRENMGEKAEPKIRTVTEHGDSRREWTKITFKPDLPRCVVCGLPS